MSKKCKAFSAAGLKPEDRKSFYAGWDAAIEQAQQELVAWPDGLIDRIKAAEQRIHDGHAPRRIPADPTDVDLVLAEVRYLLEGKQPPFWVHTHPAPAQPAKPLSDDVRVPLSVLEAAESSLGSFCSDQGWSAEDMQNMDNLSAYIARHKAANSIKEQ